MDLPRTVPVLDKGYVTLERMMGDELSIVNSARVSFNAQSEELTERDRGLINFLMRERHSTPFESIVFSFEVKVPLFVAREWMRHRLASINEVSARYSHIDDEYYVPEPSEIREQHGKPGDYYFEPVKDENLAQAAVAMISQQQREAFATYNTLCEQGVAKEVARTVLPVGMYTRFKWTVNLRALLNFLSLRAHKHAQYEIRAPAYVVEDLVTTAIPFVMGTWNTHGRNSI